MKKHMTSDFVRGNKTSNLTIAITVGISSFILSLLTSVFYDFWADAVAQTVATGSDWQTKLGEIQATAIMYIAVLILACIALILIIRNAFATSMNSRVHQLGILTTVGATPRQIRTLLIKESLTLCFIPAIVGIVLGIVCSFAFISELIRIADDIGINQSVELQFRYNPLVFVATALVVFLTVLFSAESPARKIAKISPLEAVYALPEKMPTRRIRKGVISRCFGIEGELATASMRQRRKALRSSSLALGLSFFIIVMFLSFMTVSKLSVDQTYYEKYGVNWDVVVDFPNISEGDLESVSEAISSHASNTMVDKSDKGDRIYIEFSSLNANDACHTVISLLNSAGISDYEIVNMEEDKQRSDEIWAGYVFAVGGFCCILALIGIAGVFSQAIGFVYQRKREFARYRSLGMTPQGVYKMLGIEGLLTVIRPLLIALPFSIVGAICLAMQGNQSVQTFVSNFPYAAILLFLLSALILVLIAYMLGAKRIMSSNLAETLKNDALV